MFTTEYQFYRKEDYDTITEARLDGATYSFSLPAAWDAREVEEFASFISRDVMGGGGEIGVSATSYEVAQGQLRLALYPYGMEYSEAKAKQRVQYLSHYFPSDRDSLMGIQALLDSGGNHLRCRVCNTEGEYILISGESA